jgi:OOP family OmpA-OmpF porin
MSKLAFVSVVALLAPTAAVADVAAPPASRVAVRGDRIELADQIYFETAKASIKPISQPLLGELAAELKRTPTLQLIQIGVHSDERGADEYNLRITADRAAAIKQWLEAQGVAPARLQAKGYGESKPLCAEHHEACWAKNRRVEILILRRAR